ncbi:hypothetical protein Vretifemale_1806 [Volvox reticuliferus]|nr:hypothetical protein Vretifemale_1806 [Volvox reticuliferus]
MPDITDVLTHSKGMRTTQQIQEFFRNYRLARKCKERAARKIMSQGDNGIAAADSAFLTEDALVGKSGRQWDPPHLDASRVIDLGKTAPRGSPEQAYPALLANMSNVLIPGTALHQNNGNGHSLLNFNILRRSAAESVYGPNVATVANDTTNSATSGAQHLGYGFPIAASELHDHVAALMLACGGTAASASLPVDSLHTELRLLATLQHWRRALELAEAQLQGQAARLQPDATCVDVSTAERNAQTNAPTHTEGLDRTQPQHISSSRGPVTDMAGIAHCQPGGGPSSGSTVQLVLGMTEDMQRNGLTDLAGQLVKSLLGHGAYMGDEQLRSLGNIMAQGGMKMDLPQLLRFLAAGADSSGREAAAVITQIMSGRTGPL